MYVPGKKKKKGKLNNSKLDHTESFLKERNSWADATCLCCC